MKVSCNQECQLEIGGYLVFNYVCIILNLYEVLEISKSHLCAVMIGAVDREAWYHPQKMEEWWMNVDPRDFDVDNVVLASTSGTSNHKQNGEVCSSDRKRRHSKSSLARDLFWRWI